MGCPILVVAKGDPYYKWLPEWIRQLRYWGCDSEILCLSDRKLPGVTHIPFHYDYPGNFSKVEMFRPDLGDKYGTMLYIDLTTVITGSIESFLKNDQDEVLVTQDFGPTTGPSQSVLNYPARSFDNVWNSFRKCPDHWIKWGNKCVPPDFYDQVLVNHIYIPKPYVYWQDRLPKQLVSHKYTVKPHGLPEETNIVKFHGRMKPWMYKNRWPENPRDAF